MPSDRQTGRLWLLPIMTAAALLWAAALTGTWLWWAGKAQARLDQAQSRLDRVLADLTRGSTRPAATPARSPKVFSELAALVRNSDLNDAVGASISWEPPTFDLGDDYLQARARWLAEYRIHATRHRELADKLESLDWSTSSDWEWWQASWIIRAAIYFDVCDGRLDRAIDRARNLRKIIDNLPGPSLAIDPRWDQLDDLWVIWATVVMEVASPDNAGRLRQATLELFAPPPPLPSRAEHVNTYLALFDLSNGSEARPILKPLTDTKRAVLKAEMTAFFSATPTTRPAPPAAAPRAAGAMWWQRHWAVPPFSGPAVEYQLFTSRANTVRLRRFLLGMIGAWLHEAETGAGPASLAALEGADPLIDLARAAPADDNALPPEILIVGGQRFLHQPYPGDPPLTPSTTLPTTRNLLVTRRAIPAPSLAQPRQNPPPASAPPTHSGPPSSRPAEP